MQPRPSERECRSACSSGSSSTSASLPTGTELVHPVATYGHKAGTAVVAVFFTLAATWYCVSERDAILKLLTALAPEAKREQARETYLAIDRRLGAYTRLRFLMVFAVGAVLSAGFYAIGLDYWLLVGAFVGLIEIVPMVGPLIGSMLVLAVGLPQSLHVALLSLLWLVVVREFQSYVVNPHIGQTVGLSPLVTLLCVAVVGVLFGGLAVVLAVPFTSAVATLIDVLVLGHDPPAEQPRRSPFARHGRTQPLTARVLFVNPRSGGGKAARAGLVERARERGIEVIAGRARSGPWRRWSRRRSRAERMRSAWPAATARSPSSPRPPSPTSSRSSASPPARATTSRWTSASTARDPIGSLDAFTDGVERRIDVAEVNGRLFLNNVSLGVYGDAVARAGATATRRRARCSRRPRRCSARARPRPGCSSSTTAAAMHRDPAVVLVSNNPYSLEPPQPPGTRPALDGGRLGILVLDPRRPDAPGRTDAGSRSIASATRPRRDRRRGGRARPAARVRDPAAGAPPPGLPPETLKPAAPEGGGLQCGLRRQIT